MLFLFAVLGCGPDTGGFDYVPVSGIITMDGQPLHDVKVGFIPSGSDFKVGLPSFGWTDESGHYTVKTFKGIEGAVVGSHRVSVSTLILDSNTKVVLREESIPTRYNTRSELTFDVPSDGTTTANFDLESSKRKR
ncbi:hypothetical protein AB1K70_04570 [Bremerella sp. JC770]|uniref:hypothetical protein n=1 Tax=Bremerella sp. JC770 TaxID=3232137 RepID=UPI0034589B1B